jgi:hypothetical protein
VSVLKRASPLLAIGGTTGGWVVERFGRLGAWPVGQSWACPLSNRVRTANRKRIPRFPRYSQDSCHQWWPAGIVDLGCGCRGVLTSSPASSRHPLILRTLPFAPHALYPVLTHSPHASTLDMVLGCVSFDLGDYNLQRCTLRRQSKSILGMRSCSRASGR